MNRGALLAACSLLLPTTLAAQASDTPQVLDPIVVTGTRTEHRISDSPVDVQLITAEDIQHSGARDVAELLEREGGVHVARVAGRGTSIEKMAGLQPLVEGGRLTAALASQISDGATATLVASERAVKDHGLTPRARVHHMSVRGDDPIYMLTAPIPATATRSGAPPLSSGSVTVSTAVMASPSDCPAMPGSGRRSGRVS